MLQVKKTNRHPTCSLTPIAHPLLRLILTLCILCACVSRSFLLLSSLLSLLKGDRYEGQLVDGRARGKGTWYYTNGERHVGKWLNHQPHGEGTRYEVDKSYFIGVWENGTLCQKIKEVSVHGGQILGINTSMGVNASHTAAASPTILPPPSVSSASASASSSASSPPPPPPPAATNSFKAVSSGVTPRIGIGTEHHQQQQQQHSLASPSQQKATHVTLHTWWCIRSIHHRPPIANRLFYNPPHPCPSAPLSLFDRSLRFFITRGIFHLLCRCPPWSNIWSYYVRENKQGTPTPCTKHTLHWCNDKRTKGYSKRSYIR